MKKQYRSGNLAVRARLAAIALATAIAPVEIARGALIYDNMSASQQSSPGNASLVYDLTPALETTGGAYTLVPGATDITGLDMSILNGTSTNYTNVIATVYIWGTVNVGQLNSSNGTYISGVSAVVPAFSNLLASFNVSLGAVPSGSAGYIGGYQESTGSPAIALSSPIELNGSTTVGISIGLKGTTSTTYRASAGLGQFFAYGVPATTGSNPFNGFYYSGSNGNFTNGPSYFETSSTDTDPLPDESLALRIYGDLSGPNQWNNPGGGAWETTTNWSLASPPSATTDAAFNLSSSGYTVTVNAADSCQDLYVQNDNVTINVANISSSLSIGGALAVGNGGIGSLALISSIPATIPITLANVSAGTVSIGGNGGTGMLTVASGVNVVSTGTVGIASGSALFVAPGGRLFAPAISLAGSAGAWTGRLDLGNSSLDLSSPDLPTVTSMAAQGYNNGTWNNTGGITSTSAAADTLHLTAIGVISNNLNGNPLYGSGDPLGLFEGQSPGLNDVLVKYTYYGDCLLQGNVTGSDYSIIDNTCMNEDFVNGVAMNPMSGWYFGDFNYDGVVDGSDYTLMDNAYNQQGAQFNAAIATEIAVPEPAAPASLFVVAAAMLGRQTRHAKFRMTKPESPNQ